MRVEGREDASDRPLVQRVIEIAADALFRDALLLVGIADIKPIVAEPVGEAAKLDDAERRHRALLGTHRRKAEGVFITRANDTAQAALQEDDMRVRAEARHLAGI